MPLFVDVHALAVVDTEAVDRLIGAARRAHLDRFGVRPLDHFFDGHRLYCIVEAPDEDAVRRNHAEVGLASGPVHRLADVPVRRRLSVEDRAAVRAFLVRQR